MTQLKSVVAVTGQQNKTKDDAVFGDFPFVSQLVTRGSGTRVENQG
jgi:hypothetical protein